MDAWEQIKDRLSTRLPWESFQSWFSKTAFEREDGSRLIVSVPNSETKDWIEREFGGQVMLAARDLQMRFSQVDYVVPGAMMTAASSTPFDGVATAAGEPVFGPANALLNSRYSFESFVVGSCNQFAHAAASAIAEQPARRYNPLFIYGGAGMGKTHLIQAVGRGLMQRFPQTRIVYTSGERFMNQLIQCIRTDRMTLFHQFYRSADVLLVDDVHILAGKERTQEEFFHTFNELYDHQKQIVLTSDSAPKNTPNLVERLRSRFEWGLLVDVQAPDLETKLAILEKKAEEEGIHLPDEVRVFIATKTKSNVRELEGALIKLIAYSSVTGSPITIEMARQTLRSLAGSIEKKITIESVIKAVSEQFQMQPSQLKQKTNQRTVAYPRQVAMYLVKELTTASLPEIGRAFGGKHHTTVLHSIQKIEREKLSKPELNKLIHTVMDSFN